MAKGADKRPATPEVINTSSRRTEIGSFEVTFEFDTLPREVEADLCRT